MGKTYIHSKELEVWFISCNFFKESIHSNTTLFRQRIIYWKGGTKEKKKKKKEGILLELMFHKGEQ